jgi:hypothetical protein
MRALPVTNKNAHLPRKCAVIDGATESDKKDNPKKNQSDAAK